MIKVVFPGTELTELAKRFRAVSVESFAFALARPVRIGKDWRLLVTSIHEHGVQCAADRGIPAPDGKAGAARRHGAGLLP